MNKSATLYKYAKLYSYLIKEAVIRDYNYIPKNSVASNRLANAYWDNRNAILNQPNLTADEQNNMLTRLNYDTRNNMRQAQLHFGDKAKAFSEGMQRWAGNNFRNTVDSFIHFMPNPTPADMRAAGRYAYITNMINGNRLRNYIAASINAENALGLVTPYIENPQVRNYINNIPRRIVGFNDNGGNLSANADAHYDLRRGEILLGQGRFNPHTPIHEGIHGVQAMSPNASDKAIEDWSNYTTDKSKLREYYSYKNSDGGFTLVPRAYATYDIESGANQLANDYVRKATEKLPPRMRNIIRRGMEIEGERTNATYQRNLSINPNAVIPQGINNRKFIKAVNAAARMAKVNAKQELGIEAARQAHMFKEPIINKSIDTLRALGYEVTPELEEAIRQGYMLERKIKHNEAKNIKRQEWSKRVKNNPALLAKARRLGRFVKVGQYKRMYKIFKRMLLQSI